MLSKQKLFFSSRHLPQKESVIIWSDYYREKSILSKIPKIYFHFSEICIRINVDPRVATLRHLVKLILGCHIVRLPLPTLHLQQTLGEWRKIIQENECNEKIYQSDHHTYLFLGGGNSTSSTVSVLCRSQWNLFENTITAGPQITTWHDLTFMSESILAMSKSTNWPMS